MSSNNFKDITGQRFGKLTIIKRNGAYSNGSVSWECLCDCGNIKIVNGNSLRNGSVTSCGCNKIRICCICGSDKNIHMFKRKTPYCNKHYWQMYHKGEIQRSTHDPNEIIIYSNYAEILLYNKYGIKKARTQISLNKVDLIKNYKWTLSGNYVTATINKKCTQLHKFIMNVKNNEMVDHIDRNTLNNKDDNLRICNSQQNNMNTSIGRNNTSGVIGVSWCSRNDKWYASIGYDYKNINLGYYDNFDDAVEVRKNAEEKYFGEFAPK